MVKEESLGNRGSCQLDSPVDKLWKYIWPCEVALISKPSGKSDGWWSLFLARNLALLEGGGGSGGSLPFEGVEGGGDKGVEEFLLAVVRGELHDSSVIALVIS